MGTTTLEKSPACEITKVRRGEALKGNPVLFEIVGGIPKSTAGELKWLHQCLRRGKTTRFSEYVSITPGLANELLKYNTAGNRSITKRKVMQHIARLNSGRFILTHQGIAMCNEDFLIDGQKRLLGIKHSGVTATMEITFGCDKKEFKAFDTGEKRNAGHFIGIAGMDYESGRAATVRNLYKLQQQTTKSPDEETILEYAIEIDEDPELKVHMDEAIHFAYKMIKICGPSCIATAYYWICTHTPKRKQDVLKFFADLDTGISLTKPKITLREWLNGPTGRLFRQGEGGSIRCAGVVINAWNAYITGKTTFVRDWTKNTTLPGVK